MMNDITRLFITKRAGLWRWLGKSPGPCDEYELARWQRGQRLKNLRHSLSDSPEDLLFLALLERGAAASGKTAYKTWENLSLSVRENYRAIGSLFVSGRLTPHESMELKSITREFGITIGGKQ